MSTNNLSFRLAAIAVVTLATFPLSGCYPGRSLPPRPAAEESTSSPAPTVSDEPTDASSDLPATLSFDDGGLLPSTTYIEWGDGLMADDGWEITSPDDGNGGWTYGTIDGTCTAQFWQGLASDVDFTSGDDKVASDAMLGALLQTDAASISPHAVDGAFAYQIGGNADVANRQVTGQEDGRTWIMAARAFTATGAGVYVIVDCTGGDVKAVLADVIDKNAIVVY
ncbi:hypothetical protein DC31_07570 [Microbacterium sp. CH12i]|uniref:hypothetical protein n=1 Tax=Microbacterium sp. CH12i TaxID=1479651 RepID=UPI000461FD14|nr:hypothetical protein [Microbacterium sp. CH12i]KDA06923.1 hypothetical protein DC31_07570 [Microbacterium sp. CH12i]